MVKGNSPFRAASTHIRAVVKGDNQKKIQVVVVTRFTIRYRSLVKGFPIRYRSGTGLKKKKPVKLHPHFRGGKGS